MGNPLLLSSDGARASPWSTDSRTITDAADPHSNSSVRGFRVVLSKTLVTRLFEVILPITADPEQNRLPSADNSFKSSQTRAAAVAAAAVATTPAKRRAEIPSHCRADCFIRALTERCTAAHQPTVSSQVTNGPTGQPTSQKGRDTNCGQSQSSVPCRAAPLCKRCVTLHPDQS